MKTQQVVKELEQAAERLGVKVRFEQGRFRGGLCTLEDRQVIVLNKRHPPEVHVALLAESLREMPVDTIYLKPSVRETLEEVWRRSDREVDELQDAEAEPAAGEEA
ncbi:MAG TPA: hypothetical protein VFG50_03780 [Rhodothermales bacterium]|nr:hypothetical protein [Rhodothermales bacterium]